MDAFNNLLLGFAVALTPANLFWCFVGVFLGTIVGILPGLGPPATIAMLLPLTFKLDHTGAIIMLAGIYYGAKYGGSTTSILLNMPGESASVVTCLDGYQMAKQGRAGAALGIAAISSFLAGTFGVLGLMLIAPPLARFALKFAPPEYFALMSLGLAMVVFLAGNSMIKRCSPCSSVCGWRPWERICSAPNRVLPLAISSCSTELISSLPASASSRSAKSSPTWKPAAAVNSSSWPGVSGTCCRPAQTSRLAASHSSTVH